MKITSKELRNAWIKFYESKGHVNIGGVSLIGDGTTGVMFNVAGMQPLMPYLLGQPHPAGKRLCNVQGCVRTVDIESVGDATHFTFFEMMGNWSLGDYFKKEKTAWSFRTPHEGVRAGQGQDLLHRVRGQRIRPARRRDGAAADKPRHQARAHLLSGQVQQLVGAGRHRRHPLRARQRVVLPPHGRGVRARTLRHQLPLRRYVEIGNDVYMQYKKTADGYVPLENKNVDTGFGLDRMLAFLNGLTDGYKTDLFAGAIAYLEGVTGKRYDDGGEAQKGMRIVADHTRTAVMLIGDVNGILPSNTGAGYILRRLMRRAIRWCRKLGVDGKEMLGVAKVFIEEVYNEAYPLLPEKEEYILTEIGREIERFESTLEKGMKEFEKTFAGIARKNEFMAKQDPAYVPETKIGGKAAFKLYDTYGFPLELTVELAAERGLTVDEAGFAEAFKEHQEKSHAQAAGEFKGGLADTGVMTTRLHTATHLLNAALKAVLSPDVNQKGSNITPERLRFDFNFSRPMTQEEIRAVEDLVNEKIKEDIPVVYEEMPYRQARDEGIVGVFDNKYGDVVKTYSIGTFSREMCGGPHAKSTGELGHFKIVKEQSSASGIRRIKAVLE